MRFIAHDVLGRITEDVVTDFATCLAYQAFSYTGGLNRVSAMQSHVDSGTFDSCDMGSPPSSAETFTFGYDKQNQITTVAGPTSGPNQYAATFEYTPGGRLDTAAVTASATAPLARTRDVRYEYGDGTNSDPEAVERLIDNGTGPDVASYVYDEAGNAISRTEGASTWAFVYGGEDQQRKVTAPDGSSEIYHYDESGMRNLVIERDSSGVVQKIRWYFGATEIHYDGLGAETRTLVHDGLGGSPMVRIRDKTIVEHLFHDGRGHLLVALDNQDQVKAGFTYGPFGEVLSSVGIPDDFVRRFNDKEFDQISSLSYYGARYYDPLALTWTQADPLYRFVPGFAFDEPRRANLYAFTLNNALSFADPEGLDAEGKQPFSPPPCAFTGDPGGCEIAVGLAKYDAAWAESQRRGIRWGGERRAAQSLAVQEVRQKFEGRGARRGPTRPGGGTRRRLSRRESRSLKSPTYRDREAANTVPRIRQKHARQIERIRARTIEIFEVYGIRTTSHFRRRLAGREFRGITIRKALDAYLNGRLFYNPGTGNFIRHSTRTGVSVVTDAPSRGKAISVFPGKPSPTWNHVRWRPGLAP
jgi:RHS repeat-associated protein